MGVGRHLSVGKALQRASLLSSACAGLSHLDAHEDQAMEFPLCPLRPNELSLPWPVRRSPPHRCRPITAAAAARVGKSSLRNIIHERAARFAQQNAEACFAFASELANARDMQDVLGMQGRYA